MARGGGEGGGGGGGVELISRGIYGVVVSAFM